MDENCGDDVDDEQPAKRPRLDPELEAKGEQVDDDVILALAGHAPAPTYGVSEYVPYHLYNCAFPWLTLSFLQL